MPCSFDGPEHYFHSFKPHLFEELRAEVISNIHRCIPCLLFEQVKQIITTYYDGAPRAEIVIKSCYKVHGKEIWEVTGFIVRLQPEDHLVVALVCLLVACLFLIFIGMQEKANDVLLISERPEAEYRYRALSLHQETPNREVKFNVFDFERIF